MNLSDLKEIANKYEYLVNVLTSFHVFINHRLLVGWLFGTILPFFSSSICLEPELDNCADPERLNRPVDFWIFGFFFVVWHFGNVECWPLVSAISVLFTIRRKQQSFHRAG